MIYAGFWRRALSLVGDAVVLTPLFALHLTVGYSSRTALTFSTVVMGIVSVAFPVFFLTRWGATPGKMLARIRVTRLDGGRIGARHAWLRSVGDLVLAVIWVVGILYALAHWGTDAWVSHDRAALLKQLKAKNPLFTLSDWSGQIWYWGELAVMLTNEKRRSLHDFIAGTVVIRLVSQTPAASEAPVPGGAERFPGPAEN